jgi:hypothetical protein
MWLQDSVRPDIRCLCNFSKYHTLISIESKLCEVFKPFSWCIGVFNSLIRSSGVTWLTVVETRSLDQTTSPDNNHNHRHMF